MSLALILAVESAKEELRTSAEEAIQTLPLSPVEYLIIWENESRYVRYVERKMLRIAHDTHKQPVWNDGPHS
jgi:hypothetical protein